MDDLAGILVLLGLAVLTVPLLLVMALVKIGNAKLRIDALERDVQRLQARVLNVESARAAPAVSKPAETQESAAQAASRAQPAAAPPPPALSAQVEPAPDAPTPEALTPEAPITGRARFDVPDDVPRAAVSGPGTPPPLPPERSAAAAAAQTPRPQRPPPAPPSDPFAPIIDGVRRWFTEGNVPVKIGMLVLLAGVAALLKYASDQRWLVVPIELRLAAIAAAAIGGLVFAWKQRETRRSFSLSLQGGAIGVLMLVTFAAFKLYHLIPASAAFGITIALVAGLGVLAVMQNALALAVFGILAGFLAPIWLSTGSGNHVALFSYYAVLNLGIFGIAWNRPWKLLNLLGFVFTFGIGTLWGVLQYEPEKFATTEPFLLLFFALYLLIPIFYARGRMQRGRGDSTHALVDGTLVFGTPLVAFSLQAGLLHGGVFGDSRMPLALSALGAAAIYALLAAFLRGRERFSSLVDTYAVLAVGFSTLSVPLALSARATASVFALEGAALVWLGVRQNHRLPQISGLLLQFGAAVAFVLGIGGISSGFSPTGMIVDTPIANPAFMAALLIALAGFATAWTYRNAPDGSVLDKTMVGLFALWAFGWWTFAGLNEIGRHVPYAHRVDAMFAFIALTGWIAAELRRRFDSMTVLGGIAATAFLLGVPFALAQTAEHAHPFREWGAATWAVYAALGWRALICLRDTGSIVRLFAHGGWFWSWVAALALAAFHLVYRPDTDFADPAIVHRAMGDGWRMLALGLPVFVFAALLELRPALLAPPLARGFEDYRRPLLASAWAVLAMFWSLSLFFPGDSAPLPWVSVLNPLELLQVAALALLAQRAWSGRGKQASRIGASNTRLSNIGVPLFALAAFAWITFATLRATHQWGDAAWSPSMLDDNVVQTALTVVWSVLGVLGWIFGSRRGDRLLWGAGAVLMAVVLLKLLLIDRSHLGNLFGIVSFIAYGLMCTAVGYFAPAPPRRAASAEVSA
jgi:uncharacterized membrane protein